MYFLSSFFSFYLILPTHAYINLQRYTTLHVVQTLNFYIVAVVDAIFGWRVRMIILETYDGKLFIQFELSIASSTVVCGTIPVEVLSLLTLLLAIVSIVVEHDQVLP